MKNGVFLEISEMSRFGVVCFLHTSGRMFFYQMPDRPAPRITDQGMSTVTLGWVGAINQRDPFRAHDGVVGFVDRCLPRILIKELSPEPARTGVS